MPTAAPPANDNVLASGLSAIDEVKPAIERIGLEVWDAAELSQAELASARIHLRELQAAGFTITGTATCGYSAAFIAEWSFGSAARTHADFERRRVSFGRPAGASRPVRCGERRTERRQRRTHRQPEFVRLRA